MISAAVRSADRSVPRPARWRLGVGGFLAVATLTSAAVSLEERVELLFRPPLAEQMALSPDGRRVAYTTQAGQELHVVVMDVENPLLNVRLNVDEARTVLFSQEKTRAQLRFLRWATSDRLVLAPTEERIALPNGTSISAPIMAVDADGRNPATLMDTAYDEIPGATPNPTSEAVQVQPARVFPRPPMIRGFTADRQHLVVRRPGLTRPDQGVLIPEEAFLLNVRTGKTVQVDAVNPPESGFSEGRVALADGARRDVVRELTARFPKRSVELIDWTPEAQHVLARIKGGSDQGRVFVFQRPDNLLLEVFQSAPWLKSADLNDSRALAVNLPDGVRVTGRVTWPRTSRFKIPPLLVGFPTGFPRGNHPDYDPEAQALADLGFVVLRVNHRYSSTGAMPADNAAVREGLDRLPIEDAAAMIGKVAEQFPDRPFDRKYVAGFGHGFGGYLAVRALQLRPEVFRAGIAIDAPMDLARWLFPQEYLLSASGSRDIPATLFQDDRASLAPHAVVGREESIKAPVFFLLTPARNQVIEIGVDSVRSALGKLRRPVDYFELDPGFALGLPKARAATYRKIQEFLNLRLFEYDVKIGPTKEVK